MALGALITERRDGLRLAEQALASLAEEHRAATAGRSISELIEVVTGVDAIRHRYQQVQQAATSELRMFVTAPFVAVPPGRTLPSLPPPTAAYGSGRSSSRRSRRAQCHRGDDRLPAMRSRAAGRRAASAEARARRRRPGAWCRCWSTRRSRGASPVRYMLQRSGLLAALDALFESVWNQAYPLELAHLDADFPGGRGAG